MKFRTRIVLVYSVFVLTITILLGGGFYYVSIDRSVDRELKDIEHLSRQLSQQYEESIKAMKSVSQYVLSDADALQAIRDLSQFPKGADYVSLYFSEAVGAMRNVLNTDYIFRNFYRVIFFNENGVVVSTVHEERKLDVNVNQDSLPWIDRVDALGYGEYAMLGLHEDDWGGRKQKVFSVVKQIHGDNLGYIEVQRTAGDLAAVFEVSNPEIKVLLLNKDGTLLYSNAAYNGDAGYEGFLSQKALRTGRYRNPVTTNEELVAVSASRESGAVVIAAKRYDTIKGELRYILTMTLMLAGSFIGLAVVYILAASAHLTKPIRELKHLMEKTDLYNITETVGLRSSNNEIERLRQSYEKLLKRLDSAIVEEKRRSAIQFQAQFDALQAQVNPHFIYNILNVISSRGVLNQDDLICEICDELAAMLRYSTNIKERYATVGQEVHYLEAYIKLLKCRYEHKLEYSIDLQPDILDIVLPKIVLQQLVENSVSHGYENSSYHIMRLEVSGRRDADDWYIRVRDNGEGFSQEALEHVREEMASIRAQIDSVQRNIEMKIGGMGIANTYARLYLLYSEHLIFQVNNWEQGAEVLFGVREKEMGE